MIIKFKIFERSIYTEDFINDILDKDEISDDDKLILDQVATDDKDIKELIKELHNNMLKCRDINKQMEDYIRTHSDNEKPLELLDQLTDIWDEQQELKIY